MVKSYLGLVKKKDYDKLEARAIELIKEVTFQNTQLMIMTTQLGILNRKVKTHNLIFNIYQSLLDSGEDIKFEEFVIGLADQVGDNMEWIDNYSDEECDGI
jgi:hypothetical protein